MKLSTVVVLVAMAMGSVNCSLDSKTGRGGGLAENGVGSGSGRPDHDEYHHDDHDEGVCRFPILPSNYYMAIAVSPDTSSPTRFYMATSSHLTWASALERCSCMGLELASIDDPAMFLYLNRLIAASGVALFESFWTAGKKDPGHGQQNQDRYVWANNGRHFTAVNFLPVGSGQPDDSGGCVALQKVFLGQPGSPTVTKDAWIMATVSCTESELLYICSEKL